MPVLKSVIRADAIVASTSEQRNRLVRARLAQPSASKPAGR